MRKTILGADFLHKFSLLVDIKHHQLLDGLHIQGIAAPDSSLGLTLQPHKPANEFAAILRDFPSVTQQCVSDRPVLHHVTHHIRTTGPSVSCKACRLAFSSLVASSTTCYSWESSAHLRVVGHPPCIWPRRKCQVIGGLAVMTTVHSTTLLPTVNPSLSRPPSTKPQSSANLTL